MRHLNDLESSLYRRRLAYKAWLGNATKMGQPPSEQAARLVWEMLVANEESSTSSKQSRDDVYEAAYELGKMLLPTMEAAQVFAVYRDALTSAMADSAATPDEFRRLLRFSNLISTALSDAYTDELKKASRHERVEGLSQELKLAKRIQRHLLPKVIPEIPGFEFAGRLLPAEEIGGDYWSVKHKEEDGIVTLKLADITGHGVAAATLVAAVKFISGGYYEGATSAAEVMQKTNRVLTLETPHDILVTMVYGWLRPSTYELTLVNAGHSPAFTCGNGLCRDIPQTGPLLGLTEAATYTEENYKLRKGDVVFFGSDGITEAGVTEPFGVERLKQVVTGNAELPADEIADKVVEAVTAFAPQPHDDISLLVVKVTGEPPESG